MAVRSVSRGNLPRTFPKPISGFGRCGRGNQALQPGECPAPNAQALSAPRAPPPTTTARRPRRTVRRPAGTRTPPPPACSEAGSARRCSSGIWQPAPASSCAISASGLTVPRYSPTAAKRKPRSVSRPALARSSGPCVLAEPRPGQVAVDQGVGVVRSAISEDARQVGGRVGEVAAVVGDEAARLISGPAGLHGQRAIAIRDAPRPRSSLRKYRSARSIYQPALFGFSSMAWLRSSSERLYSPTIS